MPSRTAPVARWTRTGTHGSATPEVRVAAVRAVQAFGDLQALPARVRDRAPYLSAKAVERTALVAATFTGDMPARIAAAVESVVADETYGGYARYDLAGVRHTYASDSDDTAFVVFEAAELRTLHDGPGERSAVRQFQVTLRRFTTWRAERIEVVSLTPGDRT